jgi:hypothetical protein
LDKASSRSASPKNQKIFIKLCVVFEMLRIEEGGVEAAAAA